VQTLRHILAIAVCVQAISVIAEPLPVYDNVALAVLSAADFAELNRIVLRKACNTSPEQIARPVCQKFDTVPDQIHAMAALPYFRKHLSMRQAEAALAFWSSPRGQSISKTMLRVEQCDDGSLLTPEQNSELDLFNRSDPGYALSQFARDPAQAQAVLQAISTYTGPPRVVSLRSACPR
jgi:hypothetical protein